MPTVEKEDLLQKNYHAVLDRIAGAAEKAGRDPGSIRLVVVTKGHPVEKIRAVVAAGARLLGENYVEEAVQKIQALSGEGQVEWHMIGHVQSRKAQPVCEHFDWVHSLDSLKLGNRLNRFAGENGRRLPVLLECNMSGEESKFGLPAWDPALWTNLLPEIEQIAGLPNLRLSGLMTMAPFLDDPDQARPYFQGLRRLRDYLVEGLSQPDFNELSMGMSADFEAAIQEGATLVRVGQAILGPRPR